MRKAASRLIILACLAFGHAALSPDWYLHAGSEAEASGMKLSSDSERPAASSQSPAAEQEPFHRFNFGYDQRFRHENWNDIQDQSSLAYDRKVWQSVRQRFWFKAQLGTPDIEFFVRMLNQFTKTTTPSVPLNWDEVIFDNLFLHFKKTFIPGVSVKFGRQDMIFGEGFILMDGSASEGPRTSYFNAIDITYSRKKSTLDFVAILNPRRDRFFPAIHRQPKNLNEWDEQAFGVYYRDANHSAAQFEIYYFLKKETHDFRPATHAQFQPDRHVNTIGGRVVHRLKRGFSATGEFAFQTGVQHPDTPIRAWGGYGYLKKEFQTRFSPYVAGGCIALSGDNPATGAIENWDPLFERWPKWSGMYPWSLVPEIGISYWTNSRMLHAEAGLTPWKPLTMKALFYLNDAFHPYLKGDRKIFSTGTRRGLMPEIVAAYRFGRSVIGEFRYEFLKPGDFYAGNATGHFFRFEINYSWRHSAEE